jgi:hypothetical protein
MLQVEGGPDSFLPPESSKGWAGRLYMCLVPSTTSRPYPLPPNPFSNRYGSKLREKNLANGVDFLWVACFLGPSRATWCAPKRPKQHLKHWGGVEWAGGQGWQVKFLELNCSYNFNLLWWSKDQMVDLEDLVACATISKQGWKVQFLLHPRERARKQARRCQPWWMVQGLYCTNVIPTCNL